MQILLVEDDVRLGEQIQASLVRASFEVDWIIRGDEVLGAFHGDYALVVLDLMLPGAYGLDVLMALREQSEVPILVLSAKQDASVRVRALGLGADDYLTKPFWPDELLARVQARLRRPNLTRATKELEVGELRLDLDARRVSVARLEAGEQALERSDVDPCAVVERSVARHRAIARQLNSLRARPSQKRSWKCAAPMGLLASRSVTWGSKPKMLLGRNSPWS